MMRILYRRHRILCLAPLLALACTIVPSSGDVPQDEQEPGLNDDTQLTDNSNAGDGELDTYLRSLQKLTAPQPVARNESTCGPSMCGEAVADGRFGEVTCRYDLTTETRSASEDLVAFGADDDLWAGNLVRGIPARSGELQSVPLARGSRTLSTTLLGAAQVRIEAPSNSTYQAALGVLLDEQREPSGSAVASHINTTSLFSTESLSTALGIDVGLPILSALGVDLGIEARSSVEHQHARVAVSFIQSYYRVVADAPAAPAEFFAAEVDAQDVAAVLGEEDALVYVRSVTYGRRVVAVFEDTSRASDEGLKADISAKFSDQSAGAEFSVNEPSHVTHTRFSALVLGDNTVFTDLDQLLAYLQQPADVTTAWPIAYALNYVSDDTPFAVGRTTEVVNRACDACGTNDPSETADEGFSGTVVLPGTLSDLDSDVWAPEPALLLTEQDEDWYKFSGVDGSGVVDPQASITTASMGIEVCLFVDCLSGVPDPQCLLGVLDSDGTKVGCCSTTGDAQLEGATWNGLCLNGSDSADVYVRVRADDIAEVTCAPYSITMHY